MQFSRLAFAFISVATLFAPPAAAQSVETCIAYMEADAAYEAAEEEAATACDKAVAPYQEACRLAKHRSQDTCDQAIDTGSVTIGRAPIACAGPRERNSPECKSRTAAAEAAEVRITAACQEIWAACGIEARGNACRSAKQHILNAAGETWGRAYSLAYRGPASDNPNVFEKLVLADRERCRERFE